MRKIECFFNLDGWMEQGEVVVKEEGGLFVLWNALWVICAVEEEGSEDGEEKKRQGW